MAVYWSNETAPQVSKQAVAAAPGKRIRVRRLHVTTDANGSVELRSDATPITPAYQARLGGTALDKNYPREVPQTQPGEALNFATGITGNYTIWIEYEIV